MQEYHVQKVEKPHPIHTQVPGSKSITNRALLIAALAEGKSTLYGVLFSDDSRHFLAALQSLGFAVEADEESRKVTIEGMGGRIPKNDTSVDVGSAGTAARFLVALLGLSEGTYRMNSSEQMKKRPMKELLCALEELGAEFIFPEESYHFPFVVHGMQSGEKGSPVSEITIDIDKSSQFLSALLIVSALFKRTFTIHVTGHHGMAYVEMTLRMMEQFGLPVERGNDGRTFHIPADAAYRAGDYVIEPDLSAACYFYAAGAVLGVPAKVQRVHMECLQGDIRFLHVLEDMGCSLADEEDGVLLQPSMEKLKGGTWDLSSFSDQALTLAAIAPFVSGEVEMTNIGHIQYQECDRLAAIVANLETLGVKCAQNGGTIKITPMEEAVIGAGVNDGRTVHGQIVEKRIQTFEDHRVAMAFSIPGLVLGNVVIEDPYCCRKTFEDYFEVLESAVY